MKGDKAVIEQLNIILKNELTAINQYFLHARILKDWGFLGLAKKIYDESMGEMKHADWIIERVLTLEGLPNLQDLGKLKIGENVPEMFSADLGLEMTNQSCLKVAINVCEDKNDYVTRDIFLKILDLSHGETFFQILKPFSADINALSISSDEALDALPIISSVAGLITL